MTLVHLLSKAKASVFHRICFQISTFGCNYYLEIYNGNAQNSSKILPFEFWSRTKRNITQKYFLGLSLQFLKNCILWTWIQTYWRNQSHMNREDLKWPPRSVPVYIHIIYIRLRACMHERVLSTHCTKFICLRVFF